MVTPLQLEVWMESTEDTELDSASCVVTLVCSACSEAAPLGLVLSGIALVPLVAGLAVL